ncbi:hypothetical protein OG851_01010 [Streptomyces sp. NBC_00161]|uniref:hypothetical protein n=1 Tax=Streptomyces sp. NBC_00161 TaxID=2975671 RepID=UPI003251ACD8
MNGNPTCHRLRTRVLSWADTNVSDFRIGVSLVLMGTPVTAAGAALYALSGPGFPGLVIGLACLTTGLVMVGSETGRRERDERAVQDPAIGRTRQAGAKYRSQM